MKIIGLTGGISSGKSTVARLFARDDAAVIDLDCIARQVVARGTPAYHQIVKQFAPTDGGSILDESTGEIDRKRLGALIFADPVARKKLQALTHRPIFIEMVKQLLWHFVRGTELVFLDAPLLYETGLHRITNAVVVVFAPDDVQLQRLMKRDSIDEEEAKLKVHAQMPLAKKRQLADYVVDNSGDISDTERQAKELLRSLRARRGPLLLSRGRVLLVAFLLVAALLYFLS